MDHFQQYRQQLDTALRLAAMEKQPHGVARVVLLYHEQIYQTLTTFQPCQDCKRAGVSLAASQRNVADLRQRCAYYREHLDQFQQTALKQLMRNTLAAVDLSALCPSCLARFQSACSEAFTTQLQNGYRTTYYVRRKNR
jgi:sulfur relay (sulfurtransferase) complex TusBCD TusD component (DsrE family)